MPAPRTAASAVTDPRATPNRNRRSFIGAPLPRGRGTSPATCHIDRQRAALTSAGECGFPGLKQASDHDDEVVSHPPRSCSMFLVIFVLLALATVPLAGGRLSRLADLRLRAVPVVFAALAVQVVIISLIGGGPDWLHPALHLSTYAVALWFVWVNRSVPGAWLLGAGGLCNFVVIAANGGTMPASPRRDRGRGRRARFTGLRQLGCRRARPPRVPRRRVRDPGVLAGSQRVQHWRRADRARRVRARPQRLRVPVGAAPPRIRMADGSPRPERLTAISR